MTKVPKWPVLAACIGRDRIPGPVEIENLADRIWRETHPHGCPWLEVAVGSEEHRTTVAVAHAAVGLPAGDVAKACTTQTALDPCRSQIVTSGSHNPAKDEGAKASSDELGSFLSNRPLDDCDYAVLAAFRRDLRAFLRFSENAAEAAGTTAQQYQVLLALRASPTGHLSVGELADEMSLAPHSASGLVSRLEVAGLIKRLKRREDARRVDVRIALRGINVLASLARIHREELKQLRPMLEDLIARLGVSCSGANAGAGSTQNSHG